MAIIISSGVYSSGAVVNSDSVYVYSGGTAEAFSLTNHAKLYISGGTVLSPEVNGVSDIEQTAGYLSGGRVGGTKDENCSYTLSGGTALGVTLLAYCEETVYSGAYVSYTLVSANAVQTVTDGATVSNTRLKSRGTLVVLSGGTAVNVLVSSATTIDNGGNIVASVIGGDTKTKITGTNRYGAFSLSNGVATDFLLYNSAYLTVEEEGLASGTILMSGAVLDVEAGGSALNTTQNSGGIINCIIAGGDGTLISGTNVSGTFRLQDGVASGFLLYEGAYQSVEEGGIASDTEIFAYGMLDVQYGGSAADVRLSSSGELYIAAGGTATGVIQSEGGVIQLDVSGDDETYVTGVNELGGNFRLSGGTASGFVLTSSSYQYVSEGGRILDTVISGGGELYFFGGEGSDMILRDAASVNLYDGTSASNVTLSGGFLGMVSGSLRDVTILSGGEVEADGGMLQNVAVRNGSMGLSGTMTLSGAFSMTNEAQIICNDAEVTVSGTSFEYDLISVASEHLLVEDFSAIAGSVFTISCDSSKVMGEYLLAGNAAGCTDSFSLVVDDAAVSTLSVGDSVDYHNKTYSLLDDSGVLTLSVSGDGEFAYLYAGASAVTSGTVLNGYTLDASPYTKIKVMGGTAKNTVIRTGGTIEMQSGAVTSTAMNGGSIRVQNGHLSGLDMAGGSLALEDGFAEGVTYSGGAITLSGGTLTHADLTAAKATDVCLSASGAAEARVAVNDLTVSGGTTFIRQYTDVSGLSALAGTVNMDNNGVATSGRTTVSGIVLSGGTIRGNAGLTLNDVSIYGGLLWVSQTAYASNVTLYGGSMSARGNTPRLTALHVSGGVLEVQHAIVNTLEVAGGTVQLYASNGTVSATGIVLSDGLLDLTPTGAGDLIVKDVAISGGTMKYDTTGTTRNVNVSGVVMDGGAVNMTAGTMIDVTVNDGVWNQAGGTVSGASVFGGSFGFSGGTISGLAIGEGVSAALSGSVSDLTIENGGVARICSGAVISGAELVTDVAKAFIVNNGAVVSDLSCTATQGYAVVVSSGALIEGMDLNATVINALDIKRYGQVNDLSMDGTGSMVRCSGVVSNAVVSGGVLKTFYYGVIDGTVDVLSGGAVEVAYASAAQGPILGTVNLSSGARLTVNHTGNASAKITGTVNVMSGAYVSQGITGLAVTGTVNLSGGRLLGTSLDFTGGSLNFDLAGADVSTGVYVNNYGAFTTTDFACTLNVAGFSQEKYLLFGTAGSFDRTITLSVDGTSIGEIGLNTSALDAVHSLRYSLSRNSKSQIVVSSVVAGGETAASTGTITTEVNGGADVAATWDNTTSYSSGVITIGNSGNYGHVGLYINNDGTRGSSTTLCGGAASADVSGEIDVRFSQGSIGAIIGGARSAQYSVGGVKLIVGGGTAARTAAVYGGGMGSVTGDVSVTISKNAEISGQVYGGNMMNKAANNVSITGDIAFNIDGGTFASDVIGGGRVSGNGISTSDLAGAISMSITGGNFTGGADRCIYGGGWVVGNGNSRYGADYTVAGGVNISISNASIALGTSAGRGIFGGALVSNYGVAELSGGVNISIANSTVGNVFGGGWAQVGGVCAINGDVNIQLTGSTAGVIYGGGAHALLAVETSVAGSTAVNGAINISVTDSTVSEIHAIGQVKGDSVIGNATVTISGTSVAENVFGCRHDGGKDEGIVTTLVLNDFNGAVSEQIKGFDQIRFSGDGAGVFSCGTSELENTNWTFDLSANGGTAAMLTWENGSMTDDSIRLDVSTGNTAGWDICDLSGDDSEGAMDGVSFQLFIDGSAYSGEFEIGSTIENTGTALDGMTLTYEDGLLTLRNGSLA